MRNPYNTFFFLAGSKLFKAAQPHHLQQNLLQAQRLQV